MSFSRFSVFELYNPDKQPPHKCSDIVKSSYNLLSTFKEFLGLSRIVSARNRVGLEIKFSTQTSESGHVGIDIFDEGELAKTVTRPLPENLKNVLVKHDSGWNFPLSAFANFLLSAMSVKIPGKASILLDYRGGNLRRAIGKVVSGSTQFAPLYHSGFLTALHNQECWDLQNRLSEFQEKLIHQIFAGEREGHSGQEDWIWPHICPPSYYPTRCVKSDLPTLDFALFGKEECVKELVRSTKSIPTMVSLCQAFNGGESNFLWRGFEQKLAECEEARCYFDDNGKFSHLVLSGPGEDYYVLMHPRLPLLFAEQLL